VWRVRLPSAFVSTRYSARQSSQASFWSPPSADQKLEPDQPSPIQSPVCVLLANVSATKRATAPFFGVH
jgi:hypothetical protein